jgi:FkbM family methyltransferase
MSPEMQEALRTERIGSYPPPTDTELLLDWEPLLAAIELAGPKCTAVALGAGWGRWIVGFAFAAQRRGRDYHIVGVEAEPQHFKWMERHLRDNNLPPEKSRLIHAAANSYTGTCYFMVGNAQGWYGQAVVSEAQFKSEAFQKELHASGASAEAMPCVDLNEIFAGLDRVDYLHMDIQGSEADVLLACPELLDERVAVVNIGTHSELIERRLRRHFTEHGWLCRYDIPMNATIKAAVEGKEPSEIAFGDGVFVWHNPRLTGRTDVRSFKVPTLIRG